MKKLFIDKSEPVAEIIERIIEESDSQILLVVPRDARLKESASNFNLLRREAAAAEKEIAIESVDEEVLTLAHHAQLAATHPLFSAGRSSRSLSDIVSGGPKKTEEEGDAEKDSEPEESEPAPSQPVSKKKPSLRRKLAVEEEPLEVEPEPRISSYEDHASLASDTSSGFVSEDPEQESAGEDEGPAAKSPWQDFPKWTEEARPSRSGRKVVFAILAMLLVLGGGAWATAAWSGKATVVVNFNKIPFNFEGDVVASKNVSELDPDSSSLPAELFTQQRNLTQLFPASGRDNVNHKAKGTITIYNAFSSQAQPLVATTRFQTPDGKIFRLDKAVTVPGAVIKDGKITPSSIDAEVTADAAGTEYNVPALPKLTIPGFQGTPKFDAFYGEFKAPITGGFIGERAVPTDADSEAAKKRMTEILRSSFETAALANRPEDFKILPEASEVNIVRLTVKPETDENGNFSVFGEAQFKAIGFRQSDVEQLLILKSGEQPAPMRFQNLSIAFSNINPNFETGEVSLKVAASASLLPVFDKDTFKSEIMGDKVSEVEGYIQNLPNFSDGKVTLWPLWLSRVPQDSAKIEVISE